MFNKMKLLQNGRMSISKHNSLCTVIGAKHANFFSVTLEIFSNIGDLNVIIKVIKTLNHGA